MAQEQQLSVLPSMAAALAQADAVEKMWAFSKNSMSATLQSSIPSTSRSASSASALVAMTPYERDAEWIRTQERVYGDAIVMANFVLSTVPKNNPAVDPVEKAADALVDEFRTRMRNVLPDQYNLRITAAEAVAPNGQQDACGYVFRLRYLMMHAVDTAARDKVACLILQNTMNELNAVALNPHTRNSLLDGSLAHSLVVMGLNTLIPVIDYATRQLKLPFYAAQQQQPNYTRNLPSWFMAYRELENRVRVLQATMRPDFHASNTALMARQSPAVLPVRQQPEEDVLAVYRQQLQKNTPQLSGNELERFRWNIMQTAQSCIDVIGSSPPAFYGLKSFAEQKERVKFMLSKVIADIDTPRSGNQVPATFLEVSRTLKNYVSQIDKLSAPGIQAAMGIVMQLASMGSRW
jgi:hypothetical protein